MSPWHFRNKFIFPAALLFLTLIAPFITSRLSFAELRSDTGAKSADEAKVLWQDAQKLKQEGKFKEAADELERFIARYPAATGFTEAHGLLGETYLLLNQPLKALKPLQFALESYASASPTRAQLLLLRTTALVMLKRWNEALLSANEVQAKAPANPELHAHASLLKGESLAGLKEKSRAHQALDSARGEFAAGLTPELQQEAFMLDMELKLFECSLLPGKGALSEEQARDQMNRRGTCLLEGVQKYLLLFKNKQSDKQSDDKRVMMKATDLLTNALAQHRLKCANPPPPLPLVTERGPEPRTPMQLKRYRAELAFTLKKECKENFKQAADFLESIDRTSLSDLQKNQREKAAKECHL